MTRAQLLKAVSEKVGRPVRAFSLQYAQLIREVDLGDKMADGWMDYSQRHVEQLVEYARKRSHRVRPGTQAKAAR